MKVPLSFYIETPKATWRFKWGIYKPELSKYFSHWYEFDDELILNFIQINLSDKVFQWQLIPLMIQSPFLLPTRLNLFVLTIDGLIRTFSPDWIHPKVSLWKTQYWTGKQHRFKFLKEDFRRMTIWWRWMAYSGPSINITKYRGWETGRGISINYAKLPIDML